MMLGITMINTAVHAVIVAMPLINSSIVYLRRRGCGWKLASGSYTRRGTSFSKSPPEECNLDVSSDSRSTCPCEGDILRESMRSCGAGGIRVCSRGNLLGAYI